MKEQKRVMYGSSIALALLSLGEYGQIFTEGQPQGKLFFSFLESNLCFTILRGEIKVFLVLNGRKKGLRYPIIW
jgi:hypothetical protein